MMTTLLVLAGADGSALGNDIPSSFIVNSPLYLGMAYLAHAALEDIASFLRYRFPSFSARFGSIVRQVAKRCLYLVAAIYVLEWFLGH